MFLASATSMMRRVVVRAGCECHAMRCYVPERARTGPSAACGSTRMYIGARTYSQWGGVAVVGTRSIRVLVWTPRDSLPT